MVAVGIEPPAEIVADGRIHRFCTNGRRGDDAGRYLLHLDDVAWGGFQDWRSTEWVNFRADCDRELSREALVAERKRAAESQLARESELAGRRAMAAERAACLLAVAGPADPFHAYLARKQIQPVANLRQVTAARAAEVLGYVPQSRGQRLTGMLLVLPVTVGGVLSTVELIDEAGRKSALQDGAKGGGLWLPCPVAADAPLIAVGEGAATVLSVAEATGWPVVAALSAGNLGAVCDELREHWPQAQVIVLADVDATTGLANGFAVQAALGARGILATPDMAEAGGTDWNDLAVARGLDEVRRQLLWVLAASVPCPAVPMAVAVDTGDFDDEPEDGDSDTTKARVLARRWVLMEGPGRDEMAARLQRRFPALRAQAGTVAEKAGRWAERYAVGSVIDDSGVQKRVTSLAGLNERFGLLEVPGQSSCVIHARDALPISPVDFQSRVSGEVVITGVDSQGKPRIMPAFKAWRESCDKRRFRRVVFSPETAGVDELNLFTGYGVPSVKGDCTLILEHLKTVICAGNPEAYAALLRLMAWQFQNPGTPSRIITVLVSEEQQTGKGTLLENILLPLSGLGGFMTNDPAHGLGNFNESLRGKFYFFLDECSFAGDRKLADKLKSLSVAKVLPIEGKGLPVITLPSGLNLWLATNHFHAAHAELHDDRYWFLPVSACRRGDYDYFVALHGEINHGGLEAFLHVLLTLDVSGFVPQRDVPRKNALMKDVKTMSLPVGHPYQWITECLEAGQLLHVQDTPTAGWRPWLPGGMTMAGSLLHVGYRNWAGTVQDRRCSEFPTNQFWRVLDELGFAMHQRTRQQRIRLVPDPDMCREALERKLGGEGRQ